MRYWRREKAFGRGTELPEWLNREMREASVNYKQQAWIRIGIRSTMEYRIRGRREEKKIDFN